MRPSRVGRKVDENQAAIKAALEARCCLVLSLAPLGNGAPDLLVRGGNVAGYWKTGMMTLLEVKRPGPASARKLTPMETAFHALWPVTIVQTVEEALAAVGLG